MAVLKCFIEHPASVGETYLQHMAFAGSFGTRMILGGLACCLHGLFPFAWTQTGSNTVRALYERVQRNPRRAAFPSRGARFDPEYTI